MHRMRIVGQNERILREVYARFAESGPEAVIAILADDVVWRSSGAPNRLDTAGVWHGRAGAVAFFAKASFDWKIQSFDLQEFYAAGDGHFAVHLHLALESSATGKVVRLDVIHLVTMENGRIIRYAEIFDTAPVERATRL
jgi:ketosteroid isomerase-like protein